MADHTDIAIFDTKIGFNYDLGASVYIRMGIVGLEMEQRKTSPDVRHQYIDTPLPREFAIRLRDALTVALDRTDPDKMGRDRVTGGAA
jgi:hypothetical protein